MNVCYQYQVGSSSMTDPKNMFFYLISSEFKDLVFFFSDGTFNSLLSMVSGDTSDYSFFGTMKNMWAGPSHWKASRFAQPGKFYASFVC